MSDYADLMTHLGHKIEIANYADQNVSIECVTCSDVLLDYEREGKR